jgi:hypothetical protein
MNTPNSTPNPTSGPLLIRWRGRQEGPYSPAIIEQKLAANEIGLLHEVYHNSQWVTLREYLTEQEATQHAERLAHEEAERRAREAEERKAKDREESQRAAALVEERRKNDLLEQNIARQNTQGTAQGSSLLPKQPHRGGMILTFALLGLLVCFPFGIAAWAMGSADLAQMDAGLMDTNGRSMTSSGRTIGMLATVLWGAGVLIFLIAGGLH